MFKMKAIKTMATVNETGQITLDQPLVISKDMRVEIIVLVPEELEENYSDLSKQEILEDFRQAWHSAQTGKTIPIDQLWETLEDE
jgi:hypothetical protein